jgi:hypothetical protein
LADTEHRGRDAAAINELLKELAELRELDRRRQDHVPGSAAYDAATLEVDLRGRRLMDRFRDLEQRRAGMLHDRARSQGGLDMDGTRRLDAQQSIDRDGGSRLN